METLYKIQFDDSYVPTVTNTLDQFDVEEQTVLFVNTFGRILDAFYENFDEERSVERDMAQVEALALSAMKAYTLANVDKLDALFDEAPEFNLTITEDEEDVATEISLVPDEVFSNIYALGIMFKDVTEEDFIDMINEVIFVFFAEEDEEA